LKTQNLERKGKADREKTEKYSKKYMVFLAIFGIVVYDYMCRNIEKIQVGKGLKNEEENRN